jgi:hypothetical protein
MLFCREKTEVCEVLGFIALSVFKGKFDVYVVQQAIIKV